MASRLLRALAALETEERFLNGGCIVVLLGIFLPWISGEWLGGDPVTYTGFQFYTAFLGIAVFLMELWILLMTVVPLTTGNALLSARSFEGVRFFLAIQSTVLLLGALSVLTKVTFEFSRIEIRFGIYVSLIGSIVTSIYAFLRYQQHKRKERKDLFRHPDDEVQLQPQRPVRMTAQPPPPPPPLEAEMHHLHRS